MFILSAARKRHSLWVTALAVLLGACRADSAMEITSPSTRAEQAATYRAIAFVLDFNLRAGTVAVSSAPIGLSSGQQNASIGGDGPRANGVLFSLLGTGVVNLRTSNFTAGSVGAVSPNKVLVRADLTVENLLSVSLVTPTFPRPPVGVTGLQAFPFEILSASRAGTGQLVLSPPFTGPVQPSADWDGARHNFLNDLSCELPQSDCYSYKLFSEIAPLGRSAPRTIGFLVDVSVSEFRVLVLLAADLR